MVTPDEHLEIIRLLKENEKLLRENNELLHKMHRLSMYGVTFRILSYAILIGAPFAVYFYVIEPYFNTFGSSFNVLIENLRSIPGMQGLDFVIPTLGE